MFSWWWNWRRNIVIVGYIVLLLLLGGSTVRPVTRMLWAGWLVEQQQLPQISSRKIVKHRVKLPNWYLRWQMMRKKWRTVLKGEHWLRLLCYLLAWSAVGWIWLLRWVICVMMRDESPPLLEGNWGWAGDVPNHSATIQVQLQILVLAEDEFEAAVRQQVKSLPSQVWLEETEIGFEDKLAEPVVVLPSASIVVEESGAEAMGRCPETDQSSLTQPVGSEEGQESRSVDEPGQDNEANSRLPAPLAALMDHFSELTDPRVERTKKHKLFDIVTITICAVIGDADTWVEVAEFGKDKEKWFKTFLELPNGIPSHDTFGRVFRRLDPQQWQACFLSWIRAVNQVTEGQIVPIDGKVLRRSHDKTLGKKAIHMVSAWASKNRMVLGQVKVSEKSNEITAIPALLKMLTLSGCIVTIDAMGCQKNIASQIIDKEANYVLALKKNQGNLYAGVKLLFAQTEPEQFASQHYHKTEEKSHGRQEIRQCWTISDPIQLAGLPNFSDWTGLKTVVKIRAEWHNGHKESVEDRYYISSLPDDAEQLLQAVRTHWSIENSLHWVLDIAFREDECRIRKGHGAQNFGVLRHLALNLFMQETTVKAGIKAKRKKANRSEDYLLKVLDGFT